MQSFAVVTYRVAGKQDVQTIRFDLNDPVKRNDWDVFIDSIRAKQIGDGLMLISGLVFVITSQQALN